MEQAVLVSIELSDTDFGSEVEREALAALGDHLGEQVDRAGAGEFDGHEVGMGRFDLFFYGPDADRLFQCIRPGLLEVRWPGSVSVTRRYGKPGARQAREELGHTSEPGVPPDRDGR
jgi:hypothetical protein